jgi:hypothetical protein
MPHSRGQVIGALGAAALLATLVVVGRLGAPGRSPKVSAPVSTTATPPTPPTTVALPAPSQLRGVPLAGTGLAALLIPEPSSSAVPGLFWLDSGRLTPIGGLPRGGCYLPTTRLPHGWVLGQQADQGCPELGVRTQFYRLADGASSATRLPVTADWVVAAGDDTRLWLVDFLGRPDPASDQLPAQAIQQVDLTGHPHTPRYHVPAGYAAMQGVGGGLLLLVLAGPGPVDSSRFALWHPRSGRVLRRFDRVLAATATTVAWVAGACGAKSCPVQLSDLASGSDTQVAAPPGMSAYTGAFRPDGRYLAVVFVSGDATAPAPPATPVRVGVIDAATGRLLAVSGAVMVGGGGDFWLRVTWSPDGAWLLLSAPAGQHPQLAAWRPGDTVFHVPRRQPPTGQHLALAGF